jgi:hypothetical protein
LLDHRAVKVFLSLLALTSSILGGAAFAQTVPDPNPLDRFNIQAIAVHPSGGPGPVPFSATSSTKLPPDLYELVQAFVNDPSAPRGSAPINPRNADRTRLWPCLGEFTATQAPNPDCPTIGSPTQFLPAGAAVLGVPEYAWTLAQCAQQNFGICGQEVVIFEDDTGDITDHLLFSFVAKQGNNIVLDFGTIDVGPIPQAIQKVIPGPFDIVAFFSTNFGTAGIPQGPNNGNCFASFRYPVASTTPAFPFIISNNSTCVDPTAGPVQLKMLVQLATPTFTSTTVGCPAGQASCFNVSFTPVYTFQDNNRIFLTQ